MITRPYGSPRLRPGNCRRDRTSATYPPLHQVTRESAYASYLFWCLAPGGATSWELLLTPIISDSCASMQIQDRNEKDDFRRHFRNKNFPARSKLLPARKTSTKASHKAVRRHYPGRWKSLSSFESLTIEGGAVGGHSTSSELREIINGVYSK
ncbi:hypothetical protein EV421DRAFT_1731607 [Armillaria borealis]|uniref:Uncharacterized protein n=1 Tax=Armillaria borealis TaxID=47425 RepID=A0AA39MZE7_9AGAR|nr:hypothetical protein EV421DRAFT_1731607 [Armillaria borealis]